MDRRAFIGTLASGLLAAPLDAEAQPAREVHRIGFLHSGSPTSRLVDGFRQGLRELGWVEGQNVVIDYRFAEGRSEPLPDLAAELVRLKVDVIVAVGAPAARASKQATATIPIVGIALSDPVGQGLVASLKRPGGNVTGSASLFPELAAKRLGLIKETLPGVSRVAVLWNAANPGNTRQIEETKVAAEALGLRLRSFEVRGPDDFQGAFAAMTRARPEALLILADPLIFIYRTRIVDFAAKNQLPAMHPFTESVEAGASWPMA